LTVDFRSEATEAERVIAIGTDLPAIGESRRLAEAPATEVTFGTAQTTRSGWGHLHLS
jgi:hypothetical protein